MITLATRRRTALAWTFALLVMGVGIATLAFAHQDPVKAPARPKMEYLSQEVQADAVVPTMNDLDAQGWDLFQVIPIWEFKNANGANTLEAKSYQVFGRRQAAAK